MPNTLNLVVKYDLTFASFFSLQNNKNFKIRALDLMTKKKIYLKQSYILLTWFYYLTFSNKEKIENHKKNLFKLSVKYSPTKVKKFTATKAPMAHKTNSKEQFLYLYRKLTVSFKSLINLKNSPVSTNQGLLAIFLIKKNFKFFETNLLFLKNYRISFTINSLSYYDYNKFIA